MTPRTDLRRGLYAVTPDDRDLPALLAGVGAALRGGAVLVQYRNKSRDTARRCTEASALLTLCHNFDVPLLINDDVALAEQVDADGVHLGRDDGSIATARQRLGPHRIIGASCYNDLALAVTARRAGANYVAFGSFFPSRTKPGAASAAPALLNAARAAGPGSIAAIGGINADNASLLVAAGADLLAVVTAVFDADDIEAAARSLSLTFTDPHVRQKQGTV